MDGLGGGMIQASEDYSQTKMTRMPTMKERLDLAVKRAEIQLADAKEARAILDQHPELERLINLLQKGSF